MADDLTSTIETNAAAPASVSADGVTVQQHSLADQIAADKHVSAKRAKRSGPACQIHRVKLVAPGSTD
jgi:hypothetical protein